MATDEIRPLF